MDSMDKYVFKPLHNDFFESKKMSRYGQVWTLFQKSLTISYLVFITICHLFLDFWIFDQISLSVAS